MLAIEERREHDTHNIGFEFVVFEGTKWDDH